MVSNIDKLDLQILNLLLKDSRISYQEISKICNVSGSTVPVRLKKLESLGILKGSSINLSYEKLGYEIQAFICINVNEASLITYTIDELSKINSITQLNYVSGKYNIICSILCSSITELQQIIFNKIYKIENISSVDFMISIYEPINRKLSL